MTPLSNVLIFCTASTCTVKLDMIQGDLYYYGLLLFFYALKT